MILSFHFIASFNSFLFLYIFIIDMYKICNDLNDERPPVSRAWLRGTITLLLLMVLTWTLSLLFLHRPSLPIAAAFCVLNALHGIFIFIYYCVRNQKVRVTNVLACHLDSLLV